MQIAENNKSDQMTLRLCQLLESFKGTPVTVLGDLFLDHYIWGRVDRISPEAPVVVVNVTSEDRRLGGAGNVVRNLVSLGAEVSVCAVVGDDEPGRQMIEMLEEVGARTDGVMVDRARSTITKTRVIAHSQQVVRIDHELIKPLPTAQAQGISAAFEQCIKGSKGVIVSDYGKGTVCAEVLHPIAEGYNRGELGLARVPVLVDPKSPNFKIYPNSTVIKPNRSEASEASGIRITGKESAIEAASVLLKLWNSEMVMITLGEQGMVLVSRDDLEQEAITVDTVAQEVFDVSGAGDTVSAVFLLALASGASPKEAAIIANCAAGIAVAEVGTVAVTRDQLVNKIQSGGFAK